MVSKVAMLSRVIIGTWVLHTPCQLVWVYLGIGGFIMSLIGFKPFHCEFVCHQEHRQSLKKNHWLPICGVVSAVVLWVSMWGSWGFICALAVPQTRNPCDSDYLLLYQPGPLHPYSSQHELRQWRRRCLELRTMM